MFVFDDAGLRYIQLWNYEGSDYESAKSPQVSRPAPTIFSAAIIVQRLQSKSDGTASQGAADGHVPGDVEGWEKVS